MRIPDVAKVMTLWGERRVRLSALKSLVARSAGGVDRFDFILEQLPAIYLDSRVVTFSEEDAVTTGEAFAEDVKLFNLGEQIAYGELAEAVCELFGTKGDLVECEKAVNEWYKNLDPAQRDPLKCDIEEAACFLSTLMTFENFKMKWLN